MTHCACAAGTACDVRVIILRSIACVISVTWTNTHNEVIDPKWLAMQSPRLFHSLLAQPRTIDALCKGTVNGLVFGKR